MRNVVLVSAFGAVGSQRIDESYVQSAQDDPDCNDPIASQSDIGTFYWFAKIIILLSDSNFEKKTMKFRSKP